MYNDIVQMVEEAKNATEQAQDSAQRAQAELLLDNDMEIEKISEEILHDSLKVQEESQVLGKKSKPQGKLFRSLSSLQGVSLPFQSKTWTRFWTRNANGSDTLRRRSGRRAWRTTTSSTR